MVQSSHGLDHRDFQSCSKEQGSKGEEDGSSEAGLLVLSSVHREAMTEDQGSECPPAALSLQFRQLCLPHPHAFHVGCGEQRVIPYCLSLAPQAPCRAVLTPPLRL